MTNIGMILKIIRVKNDENLQEMAKKLNCSSSYLSFIENGKRKVPGDFYDNVIKNYDLSDDEKKELKEACFSKVQTLTLDISALNTNQKDVALSLYRSLVQLDDKECFEILKTINKE